MGIIIIVLKLIRNLFVVILSTLIALKSADLLLAYFGGTQFPIESRGIERNVILKEINPYFKANYSPPDAYLKSTDSLEPGKYLIRTDQNGFIENGNAIQFKDDHQTIIFFGGSTTEQLFVKEENRWQSILERKLNNSQNVPKVKIINAGVSGNHSMHSTINLIAKGLQLQPKYVVLMHNINDYGLLRLTGSYSKAPREKELVQVTDETLVRPILRRIKDSLVPSLYELFKIVQTTLSNKDDFGSVRGEVIVDLETTKYEFKASLNTFIDISLNWGIEPILMTQFNRINSQDNLFMSTYKGSDIEQFIKGYAGFNDVIREVSVRRNIDLIDLEKLVPSSSDYIYDSVHLNENGSKLVAEILTKYWIEKLNSFD